MKRGMSFKDWCICIGASLLVLTFVVLFTMMKVDAYGGDPACLFVKCVKVIH